jgi:hypothetical protein
MGADKYEKDLTTKRRHQNAENKCYNRNNSRPINASHDSPALALDIYSFAYQLVFFASNVCYYLI